MEEISRGCASTGVIMSVNNVSIPSAISATSASYQYIDRPFRLAVAWALLLLGISVATITSRGEATTEF